MRKRISLTVLSTFLLMGEVVAAPRCEAPFYILPMVGGVGAVELAGLKGAPAGFNSKSAVSSLLDKLEPGGAKGNVQIGYTLPLPLLSLFRQQAGNWVFDDNKLNYYLDLIRGLDRPVAVVLLANHFSDSSPLVEELAKDPVNLMSLSDGTRPSSRYFSVTIWPFTLSADPAIPVNHFRFLAMRKVLDELSRVDRDFPSRLVAVTLGGETHHLFNDLRGGTGVFAGAKYTDYSPLAKQEFRSWLQKKFRSLDEFNNAAGTRFPSWERVDPPGKDIRKEKLDGFFQHFDAYAAGHFPVYGWLHPKHLPAEVQIVVDGRHIGNAEYGINRQDVYEARPDISSANVGYRYDVDFRNLGAGEHVLQVVIKGKGTSGLLSETRFAVMTADQRPPSRSWWREGWAAVTRKLNRANGIDGWADAPRDKADFYFNPFARIWQTFREHQVESLIESYGRIVQASSFDSHKAYSHQLQPWWNGSWNDVLFSAGTTPADVKSLRPGITLYGGLTTSPQLVAKSTKGQAYGVPELNMLSRGGRGENYDMLQFHATQCAKFVSPYYFDILPEALRPADDHNRMLIDSSAPTPGGREAYSAIQRFAAQ